jgi:hypothetical protein
MTHAPQHTRPARQLLPKIANALFRHYPSLASMTVNGCRAGVQCAVCVGSSGMAGGTAGRTMPGTIRFGYGAAAASFAVTL